MVRCGSRPWSSIGTERPPASRTKFNSTLPRSTYSPGSGRRVYQAGPMTFGVAICHEGWRCPETVRWAVRHGAHIVFHPHFHQAEPGGYVPESFADPATSFHEKAALCRAAENTCYFATVNFA